jgi:hypothetical protein
MKITLPRSVPRNPLVRPSRMRQAGAHRTSHGGERQRGTRELRRELERLAAKERTPRRNRALRRPGAPPCHPES